MISSERVPAKLPRHIQLRKGEAEDEHATFEVMRRAMGFEMNWNLHAPARQHLRRSPCSSYWVAEEMSRFGKNRIAGYAHSIVRDKIWQLTEFFVLPGQHGQGIGRALLERCLEDGREAGAEEHFVLASHNPAADSLYIKMAGCLPRLPMLLLAGSMNRLRQPVGIAIFDSQAPPDPSALQRSSDVRETLMAEPLVLTSALLERFSVLDRQALGYARPTEHIFWAGEMGGAEAPSRFFRRTSGPNAGEIVGYAYFGVQSTGPALAAVPEHLPMQLFHVMNLAGKNSRFLAPGLLSRFEPGLAVAGNNEVMMQWLLNSGWRIVFQYLYMSSELPAGLDRYVCHNPLHFM